MSSNPSRSPVHKLPIELVASIFLYTLPDPVGLEAVDPRRAQVLPRSVCRHWRAVTENTAAFWSAIFIRLPPMSDGNMAMNMLKNAERWSANKDLSIYVIQNPNDRRSGLTSEDSGQEFILAILRLLPRTALLHVNTSAVQRGLSTLFPLRKASQLRSLTLGVLTVASLQASPLFHDGEGFGILDVLNYEDDVPSYNTSFLPIIPTRKLFLKLDQIYAGHLKAISAILKLEYLHLTGYLIVVPEGGLSSSTITNLDIEFCHGTYSGNEIDVFGLLPNLIHLVIRLDETSYKLNPRHPSLREELPKLSAMKTVTIGIGPHAKYGHLYPFCDCLAFLMVRAPSLVALEVQQGHALGALRYLDGFGRTWSSQEASCPNLELLRVTFTNSNTRHRHEIAQSCVNLLEERPSLRIEWYEHDISKARWGEGERKERNGDDDDDEGEDDDRDDDDIDDIDDQRPIFWQEAPDGVAKCVQRLEDASVASLASLYSAN